jgi:hypothetical protein
VIRVASEQQGKALVPAVALPQDAGMPVDADDRTADLARRV